MDVDWPRNALKIGQQNVAHFNMTAGLYRRQASRFMLSSKKHIKITCSPMMKISSQLLLFLPLTLGIGIAMSLQTAINTQLRDYLYSPVQAAFLSFLIGTLLLAAMVMFQSEQKPSIGQLSQVPWFLWLGGFLGVYAISISIYTAPKMGFLTFSGLAIFGQLLMSMLLDHFGWLGTAKTPINWQRLLGGIIIFLGVLLTLQR